jgi:hypothetical protein
MAMAVKEHHTDERYQLLFYANTRDEPKDAYCDNIDEAMREAKLALDGPRFVRVEILEQDEGSSDWTLRRSLTKEDFAE